MGYAASLFMQSLFHSWLGAAVLAAQAWVLFLAARACGQEAGLRRPGLVALAAPLLLLWLYGRYAHHAAAVADLTAAALSLWALVRFRTAGPSVRLLIVLLFTALLYPAAAGALPVFSLTAAVLEWRQRRSWPAALAVLSIGVLVTFLEGRLWFGLALGETWQSFTPLPWERAAWTQPGLAPLRLLYLLLPSLGLIAWLAHGPPGRRASSLVRAMVPSRQPRSSGREGKAGRAQRPHRPGPVPQSAPPLPPSLVSGFSAKWSWRAAGLATAVVAVYHASHDRLQKSALEVDYYAGRQLWREALAAGPSRPGDPYTAATATRAASHAGRLIREIPRVRQPEDLLLVGRERIADWKRGELYLDLGYVNEAIHHLTEAVEFCGERPRLLEHLVRLNLAVGNPDTARIYLHALARVPFHSRWAHAYLDRLSSDPLSAGDPEVARLRSLAVRQDTVAHPTVESQLLLLMGANSANRMAFEYLMTYYLLTKNLGGFARRLPHLADFSGGELSPLWEEAMVLWTTSQRQSPPVPAPSGWVECQQRLDQVLGVIQACGGNEDAARQQLQGDYGNSYFFYYFFHH